MSRASPSPIFLIETSPRIASDITTLTKGRTNASMVAVRKGKLWTDSCQVPPTNDCSFNGKDALSKHELQSHQRATRLPELDNSKTTEPALSRSGTECFIQPYNSMLDGPHSNGRFLQFQSWAREENHPEVPTLTPIDTGHLADQRLSEVPQAAHRTPQLAPEYVLQDTSQATIRSQQELHHVIEPLPLTLASIQSWHLSDYHNPIELPRERWDETFSETSWEVFGVNATDVLGFS